MRVEKKSKHLFAFDLDGTLVHDLGSERRGIPEDLLETLYDLSERHHLIIATGRRYRSALPVIEVLPSMAYAVCHNGLVILDSRGQICHRRGLDWRQALEVSLKIQENGQHPVFVFDGEGECPDFAFSENSLRVSTGVQSIRRFSGQRSLVIDREDGLPTNLHQNLVEVCAIGEFSAMLKLQSAIQESLPLDLKAVLVRNVGIQKMSVLEVFENECSKLSGVHWVRDQLGLHTVIAAGDDENDIELLGGADVSLVMDHAAEHVLKAGKIKISGPSGLRHYLQKEWLDETS